MENAFNYQGNIKTLSSSLEDFGPRLIEAYKGILGQYSARFFAAVRDFLPSYAYLDNLGMRSVEEDIKKMPELSPLETKLLMATVVLNSYNEAFAIELSSRLLKRMGLTLPEQVFSDVGKVINLEQVLRIPDYRLVGNLENWHVALRGNNFIETYIASLQDIQVVKIKPREKHIAMVTGRMTTNYGSDNDNAFGLVNDYNPSEASIAEDGELTYRKEITTVPILVFSEEAISRIQEELKLSPSHTALYAFTHEMNHFLFYALQKFPMQLAAQIGVSMLMARHQTPQMH